MEIIRNQIPRDYLFVRTNQYLDFLERVRREDNYVPKWTPAWETEEGNLSRGWIRDNLKRYTQWFLKQRDIRKTVLEVDEFGIFFMWQTHMLHPVDYARDCERILGFCPVPYQFSNQPRFWFYLSKITSIGQATLPNGLPKISVASYETNHKEVFSVRDFEESAWKQVVFSRKILAHRDIEHIRDPYVMSIMIQRYHQFLLLIRRHDHRGKMFTPTLDIDLIWHSHQLNPHIYQKDCKCILGRIINHDDNPPSSDMDEGNLFTCDKWYQDYGRRIHVKHFLDPSVRDQHSSDAHYLGGLFNFAACGVTEYYSDPCHCN